MLVGPSRTTSPTSCTMLRTARGEPTPCRLLGAAVAGRASIGTPSLCLPKRERLERAPVSSAGAGSAPRALSIGLLSGLLELLADGLASMGAISGQVGPSLVTSGQMLSTLVGCCGPTTVGSSSCSDSLADLLLGCAWPSPTAARTLLSGCCLATCASGTARFARWRFQ